MYHSSGMMSEKEKEKETPEEREKRVLDASYDALSSFDKFRLEIDLKLMSRVYDMDSHKWFYGLHGDVLTKDPRGDTERAVRGATSRARSIYGSMSMAVKALTLMTVLVILFMIVPAFVAAMKNQEHAEYLRNMLNQSLFATATGLFLRWGSFWFVRVFWTS